MKKRLIATALTMSMLVSATACSSKKSDETTVADETVAEETAEVQESAEETTTEVSESEETETEPVETETAETEPEFDMAALPTFEVTSANVNDGVWDDICSNTDAGENKSPELSWEAVDGAGSYVLYMIDTTAGNWMHMKVKDVTTNSLALGEIDADHYVGPYPPAGSGAHEYVVYVFAVRDALGSFMGSFNNTNAAIDYVFSTLDNDAGGVAGNVLAYGTVSGTFEAE